jgi:hypothetical protein
MFLLVIDEVLVLVEVTVSVNMEAGFALEVVDVRFVVLDLLAFVVVDEVVLVVLDLLAIGNAAASAAAAAAAARDAVAISRDLEEFTRGLYRFREELGREAEGFVGFSVATVSRRVCICGALMTGSLSTWSFNLRCSR